MDTLMQDLPDWARWVAQDENGTWWAYECEPLEHSTGWYENEVGRCKKLFSAEPNLEWRSSIKKVNKE